MQVRVIWGDVLFLIDFSMDFLCLYFALRLLHLACGFRRICAASVCSAACSVCCTAYEGSTWAEMLLVLAGLMGVCLIALPKQSLHRKNILRLLLLFLFLEASAGGLLTGLYLALNRLFLMGGGSVSVSSEKNRFRLFWLLCALITACFYGISSMFRRRQEAAFREDLEVHIACGGHTVSLPCVVDSGNLAREPISGLPVIFLPRKTTQQLGIDFQRLSAGHMPKSRLIPLQTVTSEHHLLWGMHPDEMTVSSVSAAPQKEAEVSIDAYIAFFEESMSGSKKMAAIVPPTVLEAVHTA